MMKLLVLNHICKKEFENKLNIEIINKMNFKNQKDKRMERFNMNNEIIKKVNEGIMNANVNITIKDFESIVRELQDKDREIRELKKLTDGLEKEKELYENKTDFLIKVVENKKIEELKEENTKLKKEKENLEDECFELEEENNKLTAELKEVKSENMKLKMEKIAKEMKTTINPEIIKAGLTSMKNCLDAMDLLSDKGEK